MFDVLADSARINFQNDSDFWIALAFRQLF